MPWPLESIQGTPATCWARVYRVPSLRGGWVKMLSGWWPGCLWIHAIRRVQAGGKAMILGTPVFLLFFQGNKMIVLQPDPSVSRCQSCQRARQSSDGRQPVSLRQNNRMVRILANRRAVQVCLRACFMHQTRNAMTRSGVSSRSFLRRTDGPLTWSEGLAGSGNPGNRPGVTLAAHRKQDRTTLSKPWLMNDSESLSATIDARKSLRCVSVISLAGKLSILRLG